MISNTPFPSKISIFVTSRKKVDLHIMEGLSCIVGFGTVKSFPPTPLPYAKVSEKISMASVMNFTLSRTETKIIKGSQRRQIIVRCLRPKVAITEDSAVSTAKKSFRF